MIRPSLIARLWRDRRGATLIEFAMILPTMCVLLLAIFDLGYRAYAASVVQGALHEAARAATVGGVNMTQVDDRVRTRLSNFARHGTLTTRTTSYYDFTGVRRPEKLLIDTAPVGTYNQGDCWEEVNGNNTFNLDRGRSGLGGADDIVRYEVTLTFPRVVPLGKFLGWSDTQSITADTVLRNQPYAGRAIATSRLQWKQDPSTHAWTLGTC